MNKKRKETLEKRGWKVGTVQELLGLSDEETMLIELRIELGKVLRKQREKLGYTQSQLAKEIKSSQSRIAKMEHGDSQTSIELFLKSLFHIGTPREKICEILSSI